MEPSRSYIVFQCHGEKDVFRECLFALLSLTKYSSPELWTNTEIWIYTDDPEWFKGIECPLPLHFKKINPELIRQWKGSIDFVHRVKIEVLLDFTAHHHGNILYLDTDIVFLHSIRQIFTDIGQGKLYMWVKEGGVMDVDSPSPIFRKLAGFLKKKGSLEVDGETVKMPDQVVMWNAGVIGFHSGKRNLLKKALAFTDKVYPEFPKHIVEQFAFSFYFQQSYNVKGASHYILHYWNMKEIRGLLASFFQHFKGVPWAELVRYSDLIQVQLMMQEKISFLSNATVMDKIRKKKWQPALPDLEGNKKHL